MADTVDEQAAVHHARHPHPFAGRNDGCFLIRDDERRTRVVPQEEGARRVAVRHDGLEIDRWRLVALCKGRADDRSGVGERILAGGRARAGQQQPD
jgi:hypothetical protein